jgi:hypothetical protein
MHPAAREQANSPSFGIQPELLESDLLWEGRLHDIKKGVAYPFHIDPCCLIERDLKREEDNHFFHHSSDQVNPFGSPGPYLRTDIIEDGDSSSMGQLGQSKIELGKIDQDDEIRFLPFERPFQSSQGLEDRSQFQEDFSDAHDRERRSRIEKLHPPSFQTFPSHSKEPNFGFNPLDGLHQVGAMQVS